MEFPVRSHPVRNPECEKQMMMSAETVIAAPKTTTLVSLASLARMTSWEPFSENRCLMGYAGCTNSEVRSDVPAGFGFLEGGRTVQHLPFQKGA